MHRSDRDKTHDAARAKRVSLGSMRRPPAQDRRNAPQQFIRRDGGVRLAQRIAARDEHRGMGILPMLHGRDARATMDHPVR